MSGLFTSAKHSPPSCLTELIDRTNLLQSIAEARDRRLLVLQTPAGYGKTTLLAQWRNNVLQSGAKVAWISFEKADRSEERFVASIVSALANAGYDRAKGIGPHEIYATHKPTAETALTTLLIELEQEAKETWLIFEDWHLVQTESITSLLAAMLRDMPANWHIALSSRLRPQLNLTVLRAQGQVLELGKNDLRFTLGEAGALMSSTAMPTASIAELAEVTEGWPIAMQLARLWLVSDRQVCDLKPSFIASIDGLADYLAGEVFAGLSEALRDFLIDSSICSRFSAALMDAMRGHQDSALHLHALRWLHGLTVPLDEQRRWYRHHHIFGEFLEGERRGLDPERFRHLHRRAADWLEEQGLLPEALEHARQSGDQARMVRLVERAGCVEICIRSGASAVRALLDCLLPEAISQRPRLRAALTAISFKQGSIAEAEVSLANLFASIEVGDMDAELERDLLLVANLRLCFIDRIPTSDELIEHRKLAHGRSVDDWWASGLIHNVHGRLEMRAGCLAEAAQALDRAYACFDAGGSAHGRFFMTIHRTMCLAWLGRLDAADASLLQARLVLGQQLDGDPVYAAVAHAAGALLQYERGELALAASCAQFAFDGLEKAEGCFETYFATIYVGTLATFAVAGADAAGAVIERGRRLARYQGLGRLARILDCISARLLINAGQWAAAAEMAATAPVFALMSPEQDWVEREFAIPILGMLCIWEGRNGEAIALACSMIEMCRAMGRTPGEIRGHLILAMAASAEGDAQGSNTALMRALELGVAEAIAQPFFEAPGWLPQLLRDFHRTHSTNVSKPLAGFLAGLISRGIASGKASGETDSLTDRERDILRHLMHRGSNKVIARSVNLSENGVKFHLKNIFRKLGVEGRAMAIAVAERMEIGETADPR